MRFLITGALWMLFISSASSQIIKDGGANMVVTPGSHGVSNPITSSNSYIFQAENSIIISPSGGTAFIVTEAGATSGQYFIARITPPESYAELKEELDGSYSPTIGGVVYFKYKEKYDGLLTYHIYDYTRTLIASGTKTTVVGTNFLNINVAGLSLLPDNYYFLEVTNPIGDKLILRFKNLVSDAN